MTIGNHELYLKNIWDWGILDGCFGGKVQIKMSDIDGFISHSNRHFLIIETKSPNVPIPIGQGITFERLLDTGFITLFIVWGECNKPEKIQICYEDGSVQVIENASIDILRDCVKDWWTEQDEYWKKPNAIRNDRERWETRCNRAEKYTF